MGLRDWASGLVEQVRERFSAGKPVSTDGGEVPHVQTPQQASPLESSKIEHNEKLANPAYRAGFEAKDLPASFERDEEKLGMYFDGLRAHRDELMKAATVGENVYEHPDMERHDELYEVVTNHMEALWDEKRRREHEEEMEGFIMPVRHGEWSTSSGGLEETRYVVGQTGEGFHPGLEIGPLNQETRTSWGDAVPTVEEALRRAIEREANYLRGDFEEMEKRAELTPDEKQLADAFFRNEAYTPEQAKAGVEYEGVVLSTNGTRVVQANLEDRSVVVHDIANVEPDSLKAGDFRYIGHWGASPVSREHLSLDANRSQFPWWQGGEADLDTRPPAVPATTSTEPNRAVEQEQRAAFESDARIKITAELNSGSDPNNVADVWAQWKPAYGNEEYFGRLVHGCMTDEQKQMWGDKIPESWKHTTPMQSLELSMPVPSSPQLDNTLNTPHRAGR